MHNLFFPILVTRSVRNKKAIRRAIVGVVQGMGLQAHWLTNVHHHSCKGVILLFIQEFQTREKSYIGLRLVMIFITFIHLQHFENSDDWIPMKYPLHTKPPTPVYASPTRFCGAQAIFDDPRNVNVCTVYPRVPAACIPPFRWL